MKTIIFSLLVLAGLYSAAQKGSGFSYGIDGSLLLNSATLPEIELNTDIANIIDGGHIVKGKANYADLTFNYRFGGFVKYDHGFGFGIVDLNYTTAKISKEVALNSSQFFGSDSFILTTLERKFSYLDIALSYNIYLSNKLYFSLGITPALLLSNSGSQKPNNFDMRATTGLGFYFTDKISISTKVELGILEVYSNTYIHHIMIPISVHFAF
ncbi:MAG: outer membrane beta-barrel protein [Draconibacterium sp.]|nr:outer membrane beta-barrel protein [Draconibacterium sp.]